VKGLARRGGGGVDQAERLGAAPRGTLGLYLHGLNILFEYSSKSLSLLFQLAREAGLYCWGHRHQPYLYGVSL
jgi:hypothetical protein